MFGHMKFRKPELIPLIFIICATALLVSLGVWQLKRLAWKEALIAQVEMAGQAVPLTSLPQDNFKDAEFRRITLSGQFLHDKEIHKTSKYRGQQVGYHVLTPLKTEGSTILVNRGWVPAAKKEAEERPETVAVQNASVSGLLLAPQRKNPFLPDNDLKNNVWLYDDMQQMQGFTGEALYPLMLVAVGDTKSDRLPVPSDGVIKLRNDHLGYAVSWFGLALIGLIMFGVYYRKV